MLVDSELYECNKCNEFYFYSPEEGHTDICPVCGKQMEYCGTFKRETDPVLAEQRNRELAMSSGWGSNIPRCPICNSTNLKKLSTAGKAAKVGLFGIFGAGDIGKTYKCNNCGAKF